MFHGAQRKVKRRFTFGLTEGKLANRRNEAKGKFFRLNALLEFFLFLGFNALQLKVSTRILFRYIPNSFCVFDILRLF